MQVHVALLAVEFRIDVTAARHNKPVASMDEAPQRGGVVRDGQHQRQSPCRQHTGRVAGRQRDARALEIIARQDADARRVRIRRQRVQRLAVAGVALRGVLVRVRKRELVFRHAHQRLEVDALLPLRHAERQLRQHVRPERHGTAVHRSRIALALQLALRRIDVVFIHAGRQRLQHVQVRLVVEQVLDHGREREHVIERHGIARSDLQVAAQAHVRPHHGQGVLSLLIRHGALVDVVERGVASPYPLAFRVHGRIRVVRHPDTRGVRHQDGLARQDVVRVAVEPEARRERAGHRVHAVLVHGAPDARPHDVARARLLAVNGRIVRHQRQQRRQRLGHAEFAHGVRLVRIIDVHLQRRRAVHHLHALGRLRTQEPLHARIAEIADMRRLFGQCRRRVAQHGRHQANVFQDAVQFLAEAQVDALHFHDGFVGAGGKLQLQAGLQRHHLVAANQAHQIPLVVQSALVIHGKAAQQLADAVRPFVGNRRAGVLMQQQVLQLDADALVLLATGGEDTHQLLMVRGMDPLPVSGRFTLGACRTRRVGADGGMRTFFCHGIRLPSSSREQCKPLSPRSRPACAATANGPCAPHSPQKC